MSQTPDSLWNQNAQTETLSPIAIHPQTASGIPITTGAGAKKDPRLLIGGLCFNYSGN